MPTNNPNATKPPPVTPVISRAFGLQSLSADISIANKLLSTASRAQDPAKAQRFFILARTAYFDIRQQAAEMPLTAADSRVAEELSALLSRLREYETGSLPVSLRKG